MQTCKDWNKDSIYHVVPTLSHAIAVNMLLSMLLLLLLDTDKVIRKVLHTCGSHMKLDKILKNFHEKSPRGGIGDLIHALLQQEGLGHLVSGLFPICKSPCIILMYVLLLICLYTL